MLGIHRCLNGRRIASMRCIAAGAIDKARPVIGRQPALPDLDQAGGRDKPPSKPSMVASPALTSQRGRPSNAQLVRGAKSLGLVKVD